MPCHMRQRLRTPLTDLVRAADEVTEVPTTLSMPLHTASLAMPLVWLKLRRVRHRPALVVPEVAAVEVAWPRPHHRMTARRLLRLRRKQLPSSLKMSPPALLAVSAGVAEAGEVHVEAGAVDLVVAAAAVEAVARLPLSRSGLAHR